MPLRVVGPRREKLKGRVERRNKHVGRKQHMESTHNESLIACSSLNATKKKKSLPTLILFVLFFWDRDLHSWAGDVAQLADCLSSMKPWVWSLLWHKTRCGYSCLQPQHLEGGARRIRSPRGQPPLHMTLPQKFNNKNPKTKIPKHFTFLASASKCWDYKCAILFYIFYQERKKN